MIYNDVIINIIQKDKYLDENTKKSLIGKVCKTSYLSPIVFEPSTESYISKITSTPIEVVNIVGNVINILKLHDDTVLIAKSDEPMYQYDSSFNMIGGIPFDYIAPLDLNSSYVDISDANEVSYTTSNDTKVSLIAVCMPNSHIVRLYKYSNNTWELFSTLGTVSNNGYTADLLDTPISVALRTVTVSNTLNIEVYVSCTGDGPNTTTSFIKRFILDTSGVVNSSVLISGPKYYNSVTESGSLTRSETFDISKMLITDNKIVVTNGTEFGVMKIENSGFKTLNMKTTKFQDLDYNDTLNIPICFTMSGENLIISDGTHLAITNLSLAKSNIVVGIPLLNTSNATIPFAYKEIKDLRIINNEIVFINNNKIFKCNLNAVADNNIIYTIDPLGFEYYIKEVIGFVDNGTVTISVNEENYKPIIEVIDSTKIGKIDTVYIKVNSNIEDIKNVTNLKKGCVIIQAV